MSLKLLLRKLHKKTTSLKTTEDKTQYSKEKGYSRMFISDCLNVNEKGHLTIGDVDTLELVERYGTPLYVMDEDLMREHCRQYKRSIDKFYNGNGIAAYASKSFCCKAVCRMAKEEGMALDVVSFGELYTAMSVDFPAERIFFHGNNKTPFEISEALKYGVGYIVVDNLTELELLNTLAKAHGDKKQKIMFRVKPGIDAHTHSFIRTGQIDSKFGLALETGEAMEAVKEAAKLENIELCGLHCHIGSQIFDIAPFEEAAKVMLEFMAQIKKETGIKLSMLNLGGGFGIQYLPEHDPKPYEKYMEAVSKVVHETCDKLELDIPYIVMEPGRSISGPAGITLYRVGGIKEIPGVRTYVSVDGGMADNPRYALYQAEYDMLIANKADKPKTKTVTVAGKCCESGDLLGENVPIQDVECSDILAVLATGAYNYSMASNYNRLQKPPVVFISGKKDRLVVKRETPEDLIRNDCE